jgi:hypothetical protein
MLTARGTLSLRMNFALITCGQRHKLHGVRTWSKLMRPRSLVPGSMK